MTTVHSFAFNPFQENTYILADETGACVIIDPGCYDGAEREQLTSFIALKGLKPGRLLNTHCHVDHVFGNKFMSDQYQLGLEIHKKDLVVLHSLLQVGKMYNLDVEESPEPTRYLEEGDTVKFGTTTLDIVFTPGHSPGSICFICHAQKFVIGGDVLFRESIGRSDLPGGDQTTLLNSIRSKLFTLADDYKVYSGHGSPTTIGHERKNNPYLQ
jgi:hydroxyacylglutathione hydrolase